MKLGVISLSIVVLATFTLAGCTSRDSVSITEESTDELERVDLNETACDEVDTVAREVGAYAVSSRLDEYDIAGRYDEVALRAEGDVKARILSLVLTLPTPESEIQYYPQHYNDSLERIGRACAVGGFRSEYTTFG